MDVTAVLMVSLCCRILSAHDVRQLDSTIMKLDKKYKHNLVLSDRFFFSFAPSSNSINLLELLCLFPKL